MMTSNIFRQDFQLYQSAHQSHLRYMFYVPEGVDELQIDFSYGPKVEAEYDTLKHTFIREGLPLTTLKKDDAFRNLMTLSINDPNGFRGAHHIFDYAQKITLSETQAGEGFMKGRVPAGNWEVILSCHGIFSEKVEGSLSVDIRTEAPINYQRSQPLSDAMGKVVVKERPRLVGKPSFQKMEVHAHTVHSDAQQSTQALLTKADRLGLDWLAITDHNTVSALVEAEEYANYEANVSVIPGLEFTTFYGHFLIHGPMTAIFRDWTRVNLSNMNEYFAYLKELGLTITVAHPFDSGNPYCTGCRWDYKTTDLSLIDAIEVWNSLDPHLSTSNELAFAKWVDLLERGYEIAASVGRDWHNSKDADTKAIPFTYVLVSDNANLDEVLFALNQGRTYGSIRPLISEFSINDGYHLGDRAPVHKEPSDVKLRISHLHSGDTIRIYTQNRLIREIVVDKETLNISESLDLSAATYIRVELRNGEGQLIAFTNPIYIEL